MRTREIRSCSFSYLKNTACCNCNHKQKQRQRKPRASESNMYTKAIRKANTKKTKEKRTKPKTSKHKQNKDRSNTDQANIQTKRRKHKQKRLHTPVTTCKNNAKARRESAYFVIFRTLILHAS